MGLVIEWDPGVNLHHSIGNIRWGNLVNRIGGYAGHHPEPIFDVHTSITYYNNQNS